ncbi:ABC transporter family protein [Chlamydia trachomatis]|nr:ABC transporter family protein [Chlamydia trachomatis]
MITLSGGEAKKSNLLVSIYKDCEIMILDEPTNELDRKGVEYFKDILQHMKKNRIIILITHDKNILNIADKIIDFNKIH